MFTQLDNTAGIIQRRGSLMKSQSQESKFIKSELKNLKDISRQILRTVNKKIKGKINKEKFINYFNM